MQKWRISDEGADTIIPFSACNEFILNKGMLEPRKCKESQVVLPGARKPSSRNLLPQIGTKTRIPAEAPNQQVLHPQIGTKTRISADAQNQKILLMGISPDRHLDISRRRAASNLAISRPTSPNHLNCQNRTCALPISAGTYFYQKSISPLPII